ncbi:MAG TPA: DUF192 domain-containing protein [Steroidobacteraceae bacterium]|nr:DUF192 domain-containing protein [Steroidobacteraceae bacterium]
MHAVSISTCDGVSVARFTRVASNFATRLIGLLNRKSLHREEGLLISPGGSIHTIGMRFPIDAVFLDDQLQVLKVASHVRPWRGVLAPRHTRHVLEIRAGRIGELRLQVGMCIRAD